MNLLSFQDLKETCNALDAFATARSQEQPDKDLILTIKKIHGRETLQAIRLSKMAWHTRLICWLGFGGSTLKAVANFLQNYEPYLRVANLKNNDVLLFHYTDEAIDILGNLEKDELKTLKMKKIKGCEIFKQCLSHHNENHSKKVYILLQEYEKIDLRSSKSNPMGIFQNEGKKVTHERYKLPIIDPNKFTYLDPFFRTKSDISPRVLGFCYEYGLGVEKDIEEAIKNYRKDANNNPSASYNLARLLLEKGQFQEALNYLITAETILSLTITDLEKSITDLSSITGTDIHLEKIKNSKKENAKALRKLYLVFIEAYRKLDDEANATQYEQKNRF